MQNVVNKGIILSLCVKIASTVSEMFCVSSLDLWLIFEGAAALADVHREMNLIGVPFCL